MHAKNSIVYNGCNRKTVKAVSEDFPQFYVIPSFAYIIGWQYINHRNHRFYWWRNIRGFPSEGRNCEDILFCRPRANRWFQGRICLYQHSHPKRDNWIKAGICRDRTIWANRDTVRECRLIHGEMVPQILSGAYNSRKIGCSMNIYLLLVHKPLI